MNAYDIQTVEIQTQRPFLYCVIAEDMKEAIEIFDNREQPEDEDILEEVTEVSLHSNFVLMKDKHTLGVVK